MGLKQRRLLLTLAILLLLLVVGLRLKRSLEIDACLDRGGRWDYSENICEQ